MTPLEMTIEALGGYLFVTALLWAALFFGGL